MKMISNTSPIIGLAKIGRISLLQSIAEEVLIPPLVYRELLGKIGSESEQIDQALNDFIRITDIMPLETTTESAVADLDEGEKQAIALAATVKGDVLLLLDDRAGRQVAEKLNIPTTGLIGILLLAKEKELVENVVPLIEELRDKGYWLSDEVVDVARRLAGE
jgi:predicted nucleic acid-binding protein